MSNRSPLVALVVLVLAGLLTGFVVASASAEPSSSSSPSPSSSSSPSPSPLPSPSPSSPSPSPLPAPATVDGLVAHLDALVPELSRSPALRADFEAFALRHQLSPTDAAYDDYVRVKLAYEATRDGGFWNLAWTITDEEPRSDRIWQQWSQSSAPPTQAHPSAWAECDELSALFAFLARRLGVTRVGLFWPTWNHTVAVWSLPAGQAEPTRVVVPTTQIFLPDSARFDATSFDPTAQKTIYDYGRRDAAGSDPVPAELAAWMVEQARQFAGASERVLHELRHLRVGLRSGELDNEGARQAAEALLTAAGQPRATPADRAAVDGFIAAL